MKKTETTDLVRELIARGVNPANAYRIINAKKVGASPEILRDVLRENLELREKVKTLQSLLKARL